MRLLQRWIMATAALYATVLALDYVELGTADPEIVMMLLATAALGLANALVRPVLILLTLPLNCLTFGLFTFAINAALFWAVGELTGAYEVGPLGALVGSIVMGLIGGLLNRFILGEREERRGRR